MALTQLAKATILNMDTGEIITVMYNPAELKLEQGNTFAEVGIPGLNIPPMQYVRGRARTLTMELIFDTYGLSEPIDVRDYTNQIVGLLATLPQTKAPPILLFQMGGFTFQCVLVDAGQRFTMFDSDGTPVRATMSVRFDEYVDAQFTAEPESFLSSVVLHVFAAGETLSGIASSYLGDASRWRDIAEANNIDNPRSIPPGQPLNVAQGGRR